MTDIAEIILNYQQADQDGVMVLVSRQAIHQASDEIKHLRSLDAYKEKLVWGLSSAEHADEFTAFDFDKHFVIKELHSDFHIELNEGKPVRLDVFNSREYAATNLGGFDDIQEAQDAAEKFREVK